MLFPEEDAPLLKAWIAKRIEKTSDADPDVLAEYVIALLKHDDTPAAVRELCEDEIPDFLTEEPMRFLDEVFQVIEYRSYRPGAPPPPRIAASSSSSALPPRPSRASGPSQAGSVKRPLDDQGVEGPQGPQAGARSHKQPRRGGRRGRMDGPREARNVGFAATNMPTMPSQAFPPFDPAKAMEAMMQIHAMGIPFPTLPDFSQNMYNGSQNQMGQQRKRGRCRDFDTKGYCSRGSTCNYDHGNEPLFSSPAAATAAGSQGEEYDPNNAALAPSTLSDHLVVPFPFQPDMSGGRGGSRRGRGNGSRGGRRGGSRAPFSADGPVHDRSKTTIVVENIPEDKFDEEEVRSFFSQFGQIVQVSMQPYKHLAIVKFDSWSSANDAYRSPKVIFDNRFVKVFWHKDPSEVAASSMTAAGARNGSVGSRAGSEAKPGEEGDGSSPELDLEAFQKKQDEAQKLYREKQERRSALERQRQELEKQQQELLAKHRRETDRLHERLAEKKDEAADGAGGSGSGSGSGGTDLLRAKLAALEQEAKMLGIDPNAAAAEEAGGGRGGFRGRGSGLGARGSLSLRGRGGRHAAYAQYSIDNRPKKLAVTGVDFTPPDKEEKLRHYLLNLGEFASVETSPAVTHVSFQDRKTAEKFYYGLHGHALPGLDGVLDLAWVPSSTAAAVEASPGARFGNGLGNGSAVDGGHVGAADARLHHGLVAASSATTSAAAAAAAAAAAMPEMHSLGADDDEAEAGSATLLSLKQPPSPPRRTLDMDYDVGDDGEWVQDDDPSPL